jgi:hypothetical protein
MFPLEFPFRHLKRLPPRTWVLDPFCGRGTTNLAARLLGHPSVGIDANPVAAAIASAKVSTSSPGSVVSACRKILSDPPTPRVPKGQFWDLCYHPDTLREICVLREALRSDCRSSRRKLLRAILLGVLHGPVRKGVPAYLSNQMPRTYATKPASAVRYWQKHDLEPRRISVLELVDRRAKALLSERLPGPAGEILRRDSRRNLPGAYQGRFARVVTSPPYLGMNQYRRDQWLRDWFLGGPDAPRTDSKSQIRTEDPERFVSDLARVWNSVALACIPGARLTIRFGSLPSREVDPWRILQASIDSSTASWRVVTVTPAGVPPNGRRQAGQFGRKAGAPINEIDAHAILGNN